MSARDRVEAVPLLITKSPSLFSTATLNFSVAHHPGMILFSEHKRVFSALIRVHFAPVFGLAVTPPARGQN
jgi:hypothetical protein